MKNKITLNEKQICEEYSNGRDGVGALCKKYHVGKIQIKEILRRNGVSIKKRGKQELNEEFAVSDWKVEKYPVVENGFYVAVDRNNGFETKDYMNKAGVLTTHIKEAYDVHAPSLYDRRMYYMRTGDYWWEQWFDIELRNNAQVKKCPYCDWETIDIKNKSGWFEQHLKKEHNISPSEHIKKFPEDVLFFKTYKRLKNREERLSKEGEYVLCPLCGKRFNKMTEAHLRSFHGMTLQEFKEKYQDFDIMSKSAYKQTIDAVAIGNMKVSKKRFVSSYEREIQRFLDDNGIEYSPNRQILIGREIDILIEKYKIGIEFDGLKFHTEFFGKKEHDYHLKKTLQCNEKGYSLIHIFEDEYVNHKEIVYEKLKHFLHITEGKQRIHGRKCDVRKIYKSQAEEFLNKFHIQGFASSTQYLGAFFNDKLVAVMCFKNGSVKNNGWELTRFATDYNYIINGIGGKLFKYFIRKERPSEVYSFADRRWTLDINDNLYTKLGFVIDKINRPDYRYYNERVDRYQRIHKMRFNKQTLSKKYGFPLSMTEIEMAQELGYDRIWDCGLIKYVYRKTVE